MKTDKRRGTRWSAPRAAVALGAGFVALLFLLPASGNSREPPVCSSVFGYTVPCGAEWAIGGGALIAGVVALLFWVSSRRNRVA